MAHITPTGIERRLDDQDLIVSKTDRAGRITYANDVFLRIAGYTEREVLGQPHSILRHPDMPRCVFRLLWQTLESRRELFAYVKNMTKCGDHYWVLAHVTPSFDARGEVVGYHSNRRAPERSALSKIEPLYSRLLSEERKHSNALQAIEASSKVLQAELERLELPYGAFVFSL